MHRVERTRLGLALRDRQLPGPKLIDDRFIARRGTYRVIYRIDDDARVVTVVDMGHRRDVYRT